MGTASWSPDGRFLVFDAVDTQNRTDLYVAGADGGPLRRLTNDNQREVNPEWSRDGRWIYYASEASGRSEIWKIPAAGGTPVQLTKQGGMEPREIWRDAGVAVASGRYGDSSRLDEATISLRMLRSPAPRRNGAEKILAWATAKRPIVRQEIAALARLQAPF